MKLIWCITLLAVGVACNEQLDAGGSCPVLCPEQTLPIQEVTVDAIAVDTTLGPFPIRGTEQGLLLASRGDTLDVRGIVRYDSLPRTYLRLGATDTIAAIDSTHIYLRIDTAAVNFTGSAVIEAYDVDTTATDTSTASVLPLFRPDRLLGSVTIQRQYFFLDDTVSIAMPDSVLLKSITTQKPFRVGLRFVGNGDVTVQSVETGLPALLRFRPAAGDSTIPMAAINPNSFSPSDNLPIATDLTDFSLIAKAAPKPAVSLIAGGLPAYRSYFRFAIPAFYLDSVVVVRAQLVVVQRPLAGVVADTDLATIYPVVVSATGAVTDLTRASEMVYAAQSFAIKPLVYAPRDSGERRIDMVQALRDWGSNSTTPAPRQTAIVLRGANEGRAPGRLLFYGLDAPAALRPKLVLSYVARTRFGTP